MGEAFFKELRKYGLIGFILAYFLYQDAETRKVDRKKVEIFTYTIEQIAKNLKEESEKVYELRIDTKINAKDIKFLDERLDKIGDG